MRTRTPTFCIILVVSSAALGNVCKAADPIRHAFVYPEAEKEVAHSVATARVVIADYPALRRDFPELRTRSDSEIRALLERHAALISEAQARQTRVNTRILTTGETARVTRPTGFRRAFHIPFFGGLLESKGNGVGPGVEPKNFSRNSDGLLRTAVALREYFAEKAIARILAHEGRRYRTVPVYAVMDLGFDVVALSDRYYGESQLVGRVDIPHPAGTLIRRASWREQFEGRYFPEEDGDAIEQILRRHGFSSGDAHQEGVGLLKQGHPRTGILDLAAYRTASAFDGGTSDPRLQEIASVWGENSDTGMIAELESYVRDFRSGKAGEPELAALFGKYLDPVKRSLAGDVKRLRLIKCLREAL